MKSTIKLIVLTFAFFAISCSSDDDGASNKDAVSTVKIKWDNIVGQKDMNIVEKQNLEYGYKTADNQDFNITSFGYYITNIILEGPNGERFEDEISISAADAKGVYHIKEGDFASAATILQNVPIGKYNKITFTVGIPEEGVKEGAAGGVLDPAAGAWFWNWNAGYIGFAIEGHASTSSQAHNEIDGFVIPEKSFAIHIGGWRDITPLEGETPKFVNNVKTITLNFDSDVTVAESQEPSIHLLANAKALFDTSSVDFSTTYSVHAPILGKQFADVLDQVFSYSHVHQ
ncbi:MbnP family protein [Aquimarina sp. I32.4]|uniref:MbnP family protein n=1 Tax=Aquimarina sp. I32.4 TaxID=2053903 RepID=UPI000CDF0738|nr:MbnP family protein [Aquimarina sp. I32.4]